MGILKNIIGDYIGIFCGVVIVNKVGLGRGML